MVSIDRMGKLTSHRNHDEDIISDLEQKLKSETVFRQRVELELREQRSQASSQNQWNQEEVWPRGAGDSFGRPFLAVGQKAPALLVLAYEVVISCCC